MTSRKIRHINPSLFSHLINFDFFFFDASQKQNVSEYLKFKTQNKSNRVLLLNFIEQFKTFKQFFRLLQFLNKNYNKSFLQILTPFENNQIILKNILNLKIQIDIITSFSKQKKIKNELKMLLLLDYPSVRPNYLYNSVSRNKFYLVQTINSTFEVNSLYSYKIFNNVVSFKRLIFIGVLINQVLK
jgi:hypothetical protein